MNTTRETRNTPNELRFARNVLVKALLLFIVANLLFALIYPMDWLGRISAYNRLLPGRQRLPYGDNPQQAYNLSLYNLEAMFASHELAAADKSSSEYRVILIGDSSTWGFLLPPEHTLSAYLNAAGLRMPDGRQLRAYNLGYPVMSLTKDLLVLSYALRYQPDLIVWPLTLESFPYDKQLFPPLLQNNPAPVRALIETYDLNLDTRSPEFVAQTFWDRTIAGARRPLADLLRLQFYGVMWAATSIDQHIPEVYTPPMQDLPADESFHGLQPPSLHKDDLAFDILAASVAMAGDTPILFINEPMFISQGENSHIRYNFFYPRWAYDDYRQLIAETSAANGWHYQDMWDVISAAEFSNSAVHLTPRGTSQFASQVIEAILEIAHGAE
ncbi:MAG: hypothetical protein JXA78_11700 [Anaerolineales bacterium]|nr:hypothetical protein [Anaerolineales bacterium]